VFSGLIAIIGLGLLWHSIGSVMADSATFVSVERLIELILPSLLTILFLPFIYFLALYLVVFSANK
jgi:hypothetical protein